MSAGFFVKLMRAVGSESVDGMELLRNPQDNPICRLSYDERARCVTVVWRKFATSVQLRFGHEILLEMLRQHGARKIFGYGTHMPYVHSKGQRWNDEDGLPRAKEAA